MARIQFRSQTKRPQRRDDSMDRLARGVTSMVASGDCIPCQERAELAAKKAKANDPRWSGILGYEGMMTGDGRFIEPDSLRWTDLPLPIRYVSADVGAHDGAQVVGLIDHIERRDTTDPKVKAIWGEGFFDLDSKVAQEAMRVVEKKTSDGVSMDLDDVTFEVRVASEMDSAVTEMSSGDTSVKIPVDLGTDPEGRKIVSKLAPTDEVTATTDGRIRAVTIVAIPAFVGAKIALEKTSEPVPAALTAAAFRAVLSRDRSAVESPLDNYNWVEDVGGLPSYIKRISKHLRKKGMLEGHAIATAVNVVKKMCATGDLNFPGKQDANAGSRAEACAAVAEWEEKKARAKADSAVIEAFRDYSRETRDKMAKEGTAMSDGSYPIANKADLKNAIHAIGRASDPAAVKTFIKKRARALGAEDLIPEEWSARVQV